jgi:hypothetical protein
MNKIKHSKFKNTGLLFEMLVRQVASDTVANKDSVALNLIKEYFGKNKPLSKELELYYIVLNERVTDINRAHVVIDALCHSYKNFNKSVLRNEKYNLIREIKKNYNLEEFFKYSVDNYKTLASANMLFEYYDKLNPLSLVKYKTVLAESLTSPLVSPKNKKNNIVEDYIKEDKEIRLLSYKILLEKFNKKYSNLNNKQKNLLKEYITNISNMGVLKEYYNKEIVSLKKSLSQLTESVSEPVIKIKMNEIVELLSPLDKKVNIKDEDITNLLRFYELETELKSVNS